MTTPVAIVQPITATIPDTYIARTFTPGSTEALVGMPRMGPLRYAQNAIGDLLTSLWNGETSSEVTWEIQIMMKQKD